MQTSIKIAIAASSLIALNCLACYSAPENLRKEPKEQFRLAEKVFLGKVVGIRPSRAHESISKEFGASFSVIYKLMPIERLKGNVRNVEWIPGEANGADFISSTQQGHENFGLLGSSSLTSDCKRAPPLLLIGATYLIFVGSYPDTKDFERIDSFEDSWLSTIRGLRR